MAKEKETKTTEVTAENVVEQIKSGNKFEAEIANGDTIATIELTVSSETSGPS